MHQNIKHAGKIDKIQEVRKIYNSIIKDQSIMSARKTALNKQNQKIIQTKLMMNRWDEFRERRKVIISKHIDKLV